MQHGLSQPASTVASQVHAQRAECLVSNRLSPQAAPPVSPLQHDQPKSPELSTGTPWNHAEVSENELTPPTSSSGLSSQEKAASMGGDTSMTASGHVKTNTLVDLPSPWLEGSPTSPEYSRERVMAAKRTSSGQVKRSSTLDPAACRTGPGSRPAHSRNASSLSNGSSITDLSQQLRTRLSYAMVKVQNGWESNTLDELESLTSRHTSPKASPAGVLLASKGQLLLSPKTAKTRALWCQNNDGTANQCDKAVNATSLTNHTTQEDRIRLQTAHEAPEKRGLAPPADIIPRPRRRPHHVSGPLTGHRAAGSCSPPGSRQRTASQNAAMEADAVETLLFMASPGNSGDRYSSSWNGPPSAGMPGPAPSQSSLETENPHHEFFPSPKGRAVSGNMPRTLSGVAGASSKAHDVDPMVEEMDDRSTDSGLG